MKTTAPEVLFLQKRSHRAGAQTSLARMLRGRPLAAIRPVVLLGTKGWLADELSRQQIDHWVESFPSPRALSARVLGLGRFARAVVKALDSRGVRPSAVFANDHQECPLALAVAAELGGIPVAGLLRTPGMDRRDFDKYQCDDCRVLLCEGKDLLDRVRGWSAKYLDLFEEGFNDEECHPMSEIRGAFPKRLLVLGSEEPRKGFVDFIEALDRIEARHPGFPELECDFTGKEPEGAEWRLRERRARFRFLGRIDDFSARVRQYPLAIHPSRAETFGMAPVEALLAGTPTLFSNTGIARDLDGLGDWRFQPSDPEAIAESLVSIWKSWPECCADLPKLQEDLRSAFHIDRTTESVREALIQCGVDALRSRQVSRSGAAHRIF